jgi:hypothetical protein
MVGSVSFQLDPPDNGTIPPANNATQATAPAVAVDQAVDGAGAVIPAPPRLPYAPDPGSYTQLWMAQSAETSAEELRQEMENYVQLYTDPNPDYTAIQVSILNSTEWAGFLTVLASNQVVLVHSVGLYSSGLGQRTPAHNRIFGLIGEKVGGELPPIIMAPQWV